MRCLLPWLSGTRPVLNNQLAGLLCSQQHCPRSDLAKVEPGQASQHKLIGLPSQVEMTGSRGTACDGGGDCYSAG